MSRCLGLRRLGTFSQVVSWKFKCARILRSHITLFHQFANVNSRYGWTLAQTILVILTTYL